MKKIPNFFDCNLVWTMKVRYCFPVIKNSCRTPYNFSSSWLVASFLKGSLTSNSFIFLASSRTCLDNLLYLKSTYKLPHDKTNKMTCAPSKDSDKPGHPPSLIRVFAVRMKKGWVLIYPLSAQRRLWSDWVDAQADLSLNWAPVISLVLSWGGSVTYITKK